MSYFGASVVFAAKKESCGSVSHSSERMDTFILHTSAPETDREQPRVQLLGISLYDQS